MLLKEGKKSASIPFYGLEIEPDYTGLDKTTLDSIRLD